MRKCALVREGRRGTRGGGGGGLMLRQWKEDDGNCWFRWIVSLNRYTAGATFPPLLTRVKTFTRSCSGEIRRTVDFLWSAERAEKVRTFVTKLSTYLCSFHMADDAQALLQTFLKPDLPRCCWEHFGLMQWRVSPPRTCAQLVATLALLLSAPAKNGHKSARTGVDTQ